MLVPKLSLSPILTIFSLASIPASSSWLKVTELVVADADGASSGTDAAAPARRTAAVTFPEEDGEEGSKRALGFFAIEVEMAFWPLIEDELCGRRKEVRWAGSKSGSWLSSSVVSNDAGWEE